MSEFRYIRNKDRQKYSYRVPISRVREGFNFDLRETYRAATTMPRIIPVSSLSELDLFTQEYEELLKKGSMAIVYEQGSPSIILLWNESEQQWEELDMDEGSPIQPPDLTWGSF